MKQKMLSLALALALCLGLVPPAALAYDEINKPTEEESISHRSLEIDYFERRELEEPISLHKAIHSDIEDELHDVDDDDYYCFATLNSYRAINPETLLTLRNTAPAGTNCYLEAEVNVYEKAGADTPYPGRYNCDDMYSYIPFDGSNDYRNQEATRLYPGQQATFPFRHYNTDGYIHESGSTIADGSIVILRVYASYPECTGEGSYNDWCRWWWWAFYIDSSVPAQENVSVGPGYVTKEGLRILFTGGNFNDIGITYTIQITNTSDQNIAGVYSLLSYSNLNNGQFLCFDVDLAPGESVTESRSSGLCALSHYNMIWMSFNDIQERSEFFKNAPVHVVGDTLDHDWQEGFSANEYGAPKYFILDFAKAPDFLRDTFGIQ